MVCTRFWCLLVLVALAQCMAIQAYAGKKFKRPAGMSEEEFQYILKHEMHKEAPWFTGAHQEDPKNPDGRYRGHAGPASLPVQYESNGDGTASDHATANTPCRAFLAGMHYAITDPEQMVRNAAKRLRKEKKKKKKK